VLQRRQLFLRICTFSAEWLAGPQAQPLTLAQRILEDLPKGHPRAEQYNPPTTTLVMRGENSLVQWLFSDQPLTPVKDTQPPESPCSWLRVLRRRDFLPSSLLALSASDGVYWHEVYTM
jgi:hypothetical protein